MCANAVLKFGDFYARLAGVKIGTLAGFKDSLIKRGNSSEQINDALSSKLRHFPRSYKSYCAHVNRLAKLGAQFPEAMVFSLLSLLPKSTGIAKQLTGYNMEMSSVQWMQQLQSSISFGSLSSKVKTKLPRNSDTFLELLGYLVELAVADVTHAFLSRAGASDLASEVAEWATRLCSYMICKHPAWCAPGAWNDVHKYPHTTLDAKIFSPVPNKNAARVFRPVSVAFAFTRTLVFEQWSSILGLISADKLEEVTQHMLGLAQRTSQDPMSVVILAGCRYLRWTVADAASVKCVRTFLRFIISQLDSHREFTERNLHITTIGSVVARLNFTNVYEKQDILSLFQVELNQIYTMCVRWSKQEDLKDASYHLLAVIFARCPSSFLIKSHNFIAKRLIGPFTSLDKSKRCIEAHVRMLRGAHTRAVTGWVPPTPAEASNLSNNWISSFLNWDTDNFSVFQRVPREEETRETRIGRVMQICEALYFKSQLSGGLKLEMHLVNAMVALLLQCTASAFEYMTVIVLPAMLGVGTMHRKENDAREWKLAALTALRTILDHKSGFATNLSKSVATNQDEDHNHVAFSEQVEELLLTTKPMVRSLAKEYVRKLKQASRLTIFPHAAIASASGLDLEPLDEVVDMGPEITAAARDIPICKDDLQAIENRLGDHVRTKFFKRADQSESSGAPSTSRGLHKSLKLSNRIRMRTMAALSQGGYRKLQDDWKVTKETTHSRLVAEIVSALVLVDPNYLCGLEDDQHNVLQALLFSEDAILLRCASLAVQSIAEALPSRIPDLLALVCRKAWSIVFASPHQILFTMAHAAHLLEHWVHHLGSKSDLPSVLLSESLQPLHMAEAWALATLCHGNEGTRTFALWMLQLTGDIGRRLETLRALAGAEEIESKNPKLPGPSVNHFSSCAPIFLGDALIDRAFYRASTDYAELEGIQTPTLRADAGRILQPTIVGLITSKHSGKCWPKLSRLHQPSAKLSSKASEVEVTKSELHTNLLLEFADVICSQKKFQATLIELWTMLRTAVTGMPNITNSIKEEATGNTLVTTLAFFFAIASIAREEESSEYGLQHALHYGEKKVAKMDRPSCWTAVVEDNGKMRNLGTFPMK